MPAVYLQKARGFFPSLSSFLSFFDKYFLFFLIISRKASFFAYRKTIKIYRVKHKRVKYKRSGYEKSIDEHHVVGVRTVGGSKPLNRMGGAGMNSM